MALLGSLRAKSLVALALISVLLLAACGTQGNTPTTSNTGSNTSKGTITVGGKLDVEAQLLTKMYTLLLRQAGYTVNEKAALGNSTIVFQAITSGQIDLYPEFTATALNKLGTPSANDPQKDYQTVKTAYDQQYQITWLDPAPLNDGYALCTSQDQSQKLGITSISQLVPKAGDLVLASPSDGVSFVDGLKSAYGLTSKSFKQVETIDYGLEIPAVTSDKAQIMVCYTTDGSITQKNFVFLQDDKNGFPAFNPAPIVRNDTLKKYPDIATALNPLAPTLTTEVSIDLQSKVATMKSNGSSVAQAVTTVATDFLKSKGLLKG